MDVMCNDGADAEESNCSFIENGQQAGLINSRQDQQREQRAERGHRQRSGQGRQQKAKSEEQSGSRQAENNQRSRYTVQGTI